ncbi:sensor histidine kinase [Nocardiopsis algeriensis]|uniref:sensor histidine kinase n=1 Tax=Nocardiopsis algeriensis TaxID=1478215 RepID=UPI003B42FA96
MSDLSPRALLDRATLWARRHVLAVDVCWAALWFVLLVATRPRDGLHTAEAWVYLGLAAASCAALALRRTRPLPALAALGALMAVHVLWFDHLTALAGVAALVGAYTVQAELPGPWRTAGFAVLTAGTVWAILDIAPEHIAADPRLRLNTVLSGWTAVVLFSLLGALRRRNREEFGRVVEHARLLETQQEQEVRLAALAERTRIAREMHDILAHSLNVVVAQADGGRYAAAADPGRAVAALDTIAQVGRESAAELHRLLDVLRDGEARGTAPAPGADDLPVLVEEYRRVGLRIRLSRHGEQPALPAAASLTVYRVVQESLANVLRHAGPVPVRVEITWSPGRAEVLVANPVPAAVPAGGAPEEGRRGHGLIGMRERVGLHGGALEAGTDEATGGWRVHAVIPWEHA